MCIGRRANTKNLNLPAAGVSVGQKGEILVDECFRTNVQHIYAVGDSVPGPMLAHKSEQEAIHAVDAMWGHEEPVNYNAIPCVMYTVPEVFYFQILSPHIYVIFKVAWTGKTEQSLRLEGRAYSAERLLFNSNVRPILFVLSYLFKRCATPRAQATMAF